MKRICVTGPESTGKTTLAARLADELGAPWVSEAARLYAERAGRALTRDDVEPIGREHVEMATRAEAGRRVIVLDTDLISTIVYGQFYYGFSSLWLDETAKARLADLYLLCDVDTPWIADGIRDLPQQRTSLFTLFHETLARYDANVAIIRGDWEQRWKLAVSAARCERSAL